MAKSSESFAGGKSRILAQRGKNGDASVFGAENYALIRAICLKHYGAQLEYAFLKFYRELKTEGLLAMSPDTYVYFVENVTANFSDMWSMYLPPEYNFARLNDKLAHAAKFFAGNLVASRRGSLRIPLRHDDAIRVGFPQKFQRGVTSLFAKILTVKETLNCKFNDADFLMLDTDTNVVRQTLVDADTEDDDVDFRKDAYGALCQFVDDAFRRSLHKKIKTDSWPAFSALADRERDTGQLYCISPLWLSEVPDPDDGWYENFLYLVQSKTLVKFVGAWNRVLNGSRGTSRARFLEYCQEYMTISDDDENVPYLRDPNAFLQIIEAACTRMADEVQEFMTAEFDDELENFAQRCLLNRKYWTRSDLLLNQ